MSAEAKTKEPTSDESLLLQHGAIILEFVPKSDKTNESEVRGEVQEILLQMYIRSRMRTHSKERLGEFADAA